jgi:lipoprotein-releasing system ATP-binding protein
LLKAQNIQKSYKNLHVLKGIDLTINKGEIISIVGSSGAGKSTLLHILGTLDKADQGVLEFNDINLTKLKDNELAKIRNEKIGFIFQFHNLLPEFTALENICIPAFIANKSEKIAHQKAKELMEKLGIIHRASHKPSELSGGEQQRVAIARALINSPDIIFADEPSGNLDSKNAEELHQLIFRLRDEMNQTFVIVTHNTELANMADRKLEMKDGFLINEEQRLMN